MKILKLLFLTLILSINLFAEDSRSLEVGDLIQIEIKETLLSEDDLRDKFKDFHIESIDKIENGFKLSLRPFFIGEKSIEFEKIDLKFNVQSVLNEEDKKIIENLPNEEFPFNIKKPFKWSLFLIGLLILMGVALCFSIFILLKNDLKNNKKVKKNILKECLESIDLAKDIYNIEKSLKEYLSYYYNETLLSFNTVELKKYLEGKEKLEGLEDFFNELSNNKYLPMKDTDIESYKESVKTFINGLALEKRVDVKW